MGRPQGVSNDLYKYHLGFLISKGLIDKVAGSYNLSEQGKMIVQNFDVYGIPKELFKASVLVYLIRKFENKSEILMQKRLRHPYYGDIETVSGKINPGEAVELAAKRKLKEETGLRANIRFVGVIRKIRKSAGNRVFEDTFYHVCFADTPKGSLIAKNQSGENFWVEINIAKKMVEGNKTFGKYTKKIIDDTAKGKMPFFYYTEVTSVKNI